MSDRHVDREVGRESWRDEVLAARDAGATFFDMLTAVDLLADGFEVVVHLWDPAARTGWLLRTRCSRADPRVPSLMGLFAGAAWHERAVAELFGIAFDGHDTTPLLLPESFDGHPLRKDFVLASRVARRWPGAKEPGESTSDLGPARRRPQPPGAPSGWGQPS
jgi:NADH-quinone oxidoreductase subunit C